MGKKEYCYQHGDIYTAGCYHCHAILVYETAKQNLEKIKEENSMTTLREILKKFAEDIEWNKKALEQDHKEQDDIIDVFSFIVKERILR